MANLRVTVLGCGGSAGVPLIGCDCAVCTSNNPKNRRTRVSVLVEAGGKSILIDTSPDLREQALRHGIRSVDAILYTHEHADHTHGIDDVRSFNYHRDDTIPAYGDCETMALLRQRFPYVFLPKPENIWYRPSLTPHALAEPLQAFEAAGMPVLPMEQKHGRFRTIGYRIGDFAYSTDCDFLPEETFAALKGVRVWLVDCLRHTPSYSHSYTERTLEWVERVKPELAVLTHMAHDLEYDNLLNSLPQGIIPACDGMILECSL